MHRDLYPNAHTALLTVQTLAATQMSTSWWMDKPIPRNGLHTDLAYNSTHNNPAITMCSENSLVKRALQMLRFKLVDYIQHSTSEAAQGTQVGGIWLGKRDVKWSKDSWSWWGNSLSWLQWAFCLVCSVVSISHCAHFKCEYYLSGVLLHLEQRFSTSGSWPFWGLNIR